MGLAWGGGGGGGGGGFEKIKKCTQNNQKTVTGRLHGRLPTLPGLSEEAAARL